ncbi:hypothetical protein QFZ76_007442 [Streptomyces sp. V4I2]|nr:hypothetical protein [Streptomyces sp. V4I2]
MGGNRGSCRRQAVPRTGRGYAITTEEPEAPDNWLLTEGPNLKALGRRRLSTADSSSFRSERPELDFLEHPRPPGILILEDLRVCIAGLGNNLESNRD